MKAVNVFSYLVFILIAGCKPSIDTEKARVTVEAYLSALAKEDLSEANQYYSADFTDSESPDARMQKMKRLEEVLGKVLSFELVDSRYMQDEGTAVFTYRVRHSNRTAIEKYSITKDEGIYKISSQSVESE